MQAQADMEASRMQAAERRAREEREQLAEDRRTQLLMSGARPHSVADVLWPA
jgi:hypothetical protein